MKVRKTWQEIIQMPIGQLPRVPVDPVPFTTSPILYHFPSIYGTYAVDLLISNNDLTNSLTFRINRSATEKTLNPGAEIALENVIIEYLEITPHDTTGSGEFLAFVLPRELLFR